MVAIIALPFAFGVKWPILAAATFLSKLVFVMLPALNEPIALPASPPAVSSPSPRPTLAIRDLSRLIDDIRRARVKFEPQEDDESPVDLEMVIGVDPRD